jgi:excisionase family DNA binding protein
MASAKVDHSAPDPKADAPRYLTLRDAATYLSLTEGALRHRVERREVPFCRLGRSLRFDRQALDRLMRQSTVDASTSICDSRSCQADTGW